MNACGMEMCQNWTGDGCACALLDLDPAPAEGAEFEQQCEACSGYFEAAEETSLCPDCESEPS